jgi:hypothetical protein
MPIIRNILGKPLAALEKLGKIAYKTISSKRWLAA